MAPPHGATCQAESLPPTPPPCGVLCGLRTVLDERRFQRISQLQRRGRVGRAALRGGTSGQLSVDRGGSAREREDQPGRRGRQRDGESRGRTYETAVN